MTAPTLTQINLAREDEGLRSRIHLAMEAAGHSTYDAAPIVRVLAVETTDDGGGPITIAGAYDYQWGQALKSLAAEGVPSRARVAARLAQVGTDPAAITDGTIQRAVAAVLSVQS
ncbi:hypothetical protein GCM10027418_06730 [Mariniluteicoccus endophyticus]